MVQIYTCISLDFDLYFELNIKLFHLVKLITIIHHFSLFVVSKFIKSLSVHLALPLYAVPVCCCQFVVMLVSYHCHCHVIVMLVSCHCHVIVIFFLLCFLVLSDPPSTCICLKSDYLTRFLLLLGNFFYRL